MTRRRRKRDGYKAWAEGSPDVSPARPLSEVLRDPPPVEKPIETPAPVPAPNAQLTEVVRVNTKSLPARYQALADRLVSRWEATIEDVDDSIAARITEHVIERLYGKPVQPLAVTSELFYEEWISDEIAVLLAMMDHARRPGPWTADEIADLIAQLTRAYQRRAPSLPTSDAGAKLSAPEGGSGNGGFGKTLADLLDPNAEEDV